MLIGEKFFYENLPVYIYGLCSPKEHEIRYIGQSCNPIGRLIQHITESRFMVTKKQRWINSLLLEKQYPYLIILDITTKDRAEEKEIEWVLKYQNLFNKTREETLERHINTSENIRQISKDKFTINQIAKLSNLSRQRVHQIIKDKNIMPERVSAPSRTGYIYLLSKEQADCVMSKLED